MRVMCGLMILLASFWAQAQLNLELQQELLNMETEDQGIRKVFEEKGWENISTELHEEMLRIDEKNTKRVKEILDQHGWPTKDLIGEEGMLAVFLIIQHSPDIDFQRSMLPLLTSSYENNEGISGQDVALLTDRVRVNLGQKQLYGTQLEVVEGRLVFLPIEDEENVDQRRAKMDMIPLAEYLKMVEEVYQSRE
ncbi:hypothetical protein BTA51_24430 [Hahella sp. CCB-MM4]|uniref:DUF6624 domain-containing protein n=1 Tax=Hahella sp. (strain CCB-MM4) TaxID=1926491 RepID=UPI000B9C0811|nr:DUF6624 domain-containing protein [Hahella sp. CCB-MM4]OZG70736.1 hypothetical protein BTA51_24430 [Hahella sp. CCB-MM4]